MAVQNRSRHKKSRERKSVYFIHDNGGRPFMAVVSKTLVSIYKPSSDFWNGEDELEYDELLLKFRHPLHIWIGEDLDGMFKGNSILIQSSKHKFVFVGGEIYSFRLASLNEKVEEYVSPVGNSDVPYPYLVTNQNVYFMLDGIYASKYHFTTARENIIDDPYDKFYDEHYWKTHVKHAMKDVKILIKRQFK